MIELMIAFAVVIILSGYCMSSFKPNVNKNKLFVYSALRTLTKANIAILEKNSQEGIQDLLDDGTTDWYCAHVGDLLSLNGSPVCARSSGDTVVNLKFISGVTVQGLAKEWVKPYNDSPFEFKNIVIDIDGPDSGPNKPWADRFPMRVYKGQGVAEGIIMPINCASDHVYDETVQVPVQASAQSPYCKTGKNYNGAVLSRDFTIDDEIITYDIYRATAIDENSKATPIAYGLSAIEADCAAYGGKGFYAQKECEDSSIKIHTKCATSENCVGCVQNKNCPLNASGTALDEAGCSAMASSDNPIDLPCLVIMHKPSGGLPFFIQAIVGDIGEDGI